MPSCKRLVFPGIFSGILGLSGVFSGFLGCLQCITNENGTRVRSPRSQLKLLTPLQREILVTCAARPTMNFGRWGSGRNECTLRAGLQAECFGQSTSQSPQRAVREARNKAGGQKIRCNQKTEQNGTTYFQNGTTLPSFVTLATFCKRIRVSSCASTPLLIFIRVNVRPFAVKVTGPNFEYGKVQKSTTCSVYESLTHFF
jgi:hypothetical protein